MKCCLELEKHGPRDLKLPFGSQWQRVSVADAIPTAEGCERFRFPRELVQSRRLCRVARRRQGCFPIQHGVVQSQSANEAFNVATRREMCAQFVPLAFAVQRPFQQRTEIAGSMCCQSSAAAAFKMPSYVPFTANTALAANNPPLNLSGLWGRMTATSFFRLADPP